MIAITTGRASAQIVKIRHLWATKVSGQWVDIQRDYCNIGVAFNDAMRNRVKGYVWVKKIREAVETNNNIIECDRE